MPLSLTWCLCGVVAFALTWRLRRLRSSNLRRLPPGPKGLPFIGNLLQLPQEESWRFHATDTLQKYGDVAYFSALGSHIIVLNSYAAAFDLLSRRSAIYSDRPTLPMAGELIGMDQSTAFVHYGPDWRSQRRVWQQHLGVRALQAGDYAAQVQGESQSFVRRVLADNKNITAQIKLWSVKALIGSAFGRSVDSLEEEFVSVTKRVAEEVAAAMMPGRYLVDIFPFMMHIPSWFPGAAWKRLGLELRERFIAMGEEPYEYVKSAMSGGHAPQSFVSEMIQEPRASESIQKWVTAGVYIAGVDTTQEAINRFIANMIAHPDIQRRAQQEIDSVVGSSRLPGIEDKSSLPYIDAVIQEVFRFQMILPFAVPHASTRDDEYRGYHIPKGSTMLPNLWAISQDPKHYPNPEKFDPERYLNCDAEAKPLDPRLYCFGIGRRMCPGRHFGQLAVYTTITTLLATVDILKPVGEDGAEYTPNIEFEGNGLSSMCPFEARIVPRSNEAMALLNGD